MPQKYLSEAYEQLSQESKDYIARYIRTLDKTKEQAMEEKLVQLVIAEYEHGNKTRTVFA